MMELLALNNVFDLESFINLSPDLVCVAGFDGYFKKINPAVSETLGYSDEELFSKPISYFIHGDDKLATGRRREEILDGTPLLNFENRYVTKSGEIVWFTWTSIPIKAEQVVFAIAKNITDKKNEADKPLSLSSNSAIVNKLAVTSVQHLSAPDQAWLFELQLLVKKYTGNMNINIGLLSQELSISERQLYRRIKSILGVTPNQYIRGIRLQVAKEAIETGKYRTVSEISYIAGFDTPAYFSKLFEEVYGVSVSELLCSR
ncbi:helix-turn-helix domain-containing protein [Mucilaginibacter sp. FT3.2]|uniref:helix-turn-helix domain-containing protein n=1 Tax=Mucilaginibacter sp. FT3.2 TaxID=2723090 RepID=UPI0018189DB3|nr:helix-turn-helix domain-containing protein [Mucilaginibacter sp. FT3.2]MBB6233881.1 PAS domain S-box-containing protein [Mucilaginibacter sp. FT3.2]